MQASKESRGPTEEIDEDKRPIVVSPTKGREMVECQDAMPSSNVVFSHAQSIASKDRQPSSPFFLVNLAGALLEIFLDLRLVQR